jgi:hypothetical protein
MRAGIEISLFLALICGLTAISPCQTNPASSTPSQTAEKSVTPEHPRSNSVVYSNYRYGFRLYLPKSWKGFTVIESSWEGTSASNGPTEGGPLIRIRHPLYTVQHPREDIPIMVIRRDQWREIKNDKLIVSAAPIPPGEIGRNEKYVFATPPRYSFDELEGVEEVIKIVNSKPLPLQITHVP